MQVLEGSFFLYESIAVATKINLPENVQGRKDLRELSRVTADDGVSLIALEKSTGKPIAVAFNKIQVSVKKEKSKGPTAGKHEVPVLAKLAGFKGKFVFRINS